MIVLNESGEDIEVRHLNLVRSAARLYVYHRPTGTKLTGVRCDQGGRLILTQDGIDQLRRLNAPKPAAVPGSLGELIDAFTQTAAWRDYAVRTRKDYERIFEWLAPSRGATRLRDMPLACLNAPFVVAIRDSAHADHGWRFANYVLSVLSKLSEWARAKRLIDVNPCSGVERVKRPRQARHVNRRWAPEEIDAVLAAAQKRAPQLLLPINLGRFTGMREGDVLNLKVDAWDGQTLRWRARKNGAEMSLAPPPRELVRVLDHACRTRTQGQRNLCSNAFGASWAENGSGFRASFFKLIRSLEREGKVRPGLTFHGLRHTVGVELAERGASEETMKAVLGNVSSAALKVYLRSANKAIATQRGVSLLDGEASPTPLAA